MNDKMGYVFELSEIDQTRRAEFGGKGANLGELTRINGVEVPDGFCVSTEAFNWVVYGNPSVQELLGQLSLLTIEDRGKIAERSAEIRSAIELIQIPQDLRNEIVNYLVRFGEQDAYAVRSSATAEDLPTASFAGQQDTYLNCVGKEAILQQIVKCWASLFTERAVMYRLQTTSSAVKVDQQQVQLAVIVQKMVFPAVSGILFTADPVTANRKILSIDASFGLGEALVSGLVNADNYTVRSGQIIGKKLSTKKLAMAAIKEGGTKKDEIEPEKQRSQALSDGRILQLERIGRTIEAHFGCPQDIEWCLVEDQFYIVQSRPITTLYPVPEASNGATTEQGPRIYVSVGHQQMMTDAMKPLGLSIWQLSSGRPMPQAGGRLFVDVADDLASPTRREVIINVLGKFNPLIKDALTTILERGDLIHLPPDSQKVVSDNGNQGPSYADYQTLKEFDPAIVSELIDHSQTQIAALQQTIQGLSGTDVFDFIENDIQQPRRAMADPQSFGVIMTGMNASTWINEHIQNWLGDKNVADTLTQSVPHNVTSEMGLALLDVADTIRPYPDIIAYLQQVSLSPEKQDRFLDDLVQFDGGKEARKAIEAYLTKYGMRCVGEIDITKSRWSEKPAILIPLLLGNIKNFEPGASKQKFEQGRQEALRKEQELLERLRQLPDGEQKAKETKRMIDLVRNFAGYREYPKYDIVSRYAIYKQALLNEAEQLVKAGVIRKKEDIYYLRFEELRDVVRTRNLDYNIIRERKAEYKRYEKLTPPLIMTSDGEIVTGRHKRENMPADAIVGLAVSSGTVEGRARVILDLESADLEPGDILITSFTDPSWTPLFVSIKGLVTEVGGLMTHGAVIAREYGLPAVVGVENGTRLIKDGQQIRVNGTEGYIEILS